MKVNESAWPATVSSLTEDFTGLGVAKGMTLLVHSSLKSLNRWIVGGPPAVIHALEEAIGEEGTLVMPTHTSDLSDPTLWENPPVPKAWWDTIRKEMPAFDRDLTPTWGMGAVAECFRKQDGTHRSNHPQVSFAARGPEALFITGDHSLPYGLGEQSPLARLYDRNAWVLLIGVNHDNNTSLHLAEYRSDYPHKKQTKLETACKVNGQREWVSFDDISFDTEDFIEIGQAFEQASGLVRIGTIGDATVRLMPQRELVDYAKYWMDSYRWGQ
ncbi:AAC(3) family N-acetyltransferase [Paenibacillus baekrokdamisoli]|uniref:Aminoglycoside N(3)-acetyltransferase n=2 Tax=Paenibacillus baekrokdamisoli TaxID=1712516 RepID=A0A3G9IT16_9BACL|nr:AAC(3) family N-acetyltransferase [Paenibacillus baekrokdamisoli]MBB3067638.1 aminoglycoside 3-N-acetyltransferase [Paenibacillus baekrokdamisoli]BBH19175.1 AAC(3) family N-acetyltransferase [Paenibacillus baekrokdamisoli]